MIFANNSLPKIEGGDSMDPEMREIAIALQNFLNKVNDALAEVKKDKGYITTNDIINSIDNTEP